MSRHSSLLLLVVGSMIQVGCGSGAVPTDPNPPAPTSAAENAGDDATATAFPMLISAAELLFNAGSPDRDVIILDVRSAGAYDAGHIPGAIRVEANDWRDLGLAEGGLHDEAAWAEHVGGLGIDGSVPVAVYSDIPTNAARIWWTLKYVGVPDVAILDGGWSAWVTLGAPTSATPETPQAVAFVPNFQEQRVAEIDDVKAGVDGGSLTIIDTRSDDEYAVHIPGAVHLEWTHLLNDDNTYKSPEEIRDLLAERGIASGGENVMHCQTGGRASVNAFALELAGFGPAKNYYCGWSEWSAADDNPVESVFPGG